MRIFFVTSNRGKYSEAAEKLQIRGMDLVQKNIGYPEIQADTSEDVVKFGLQTIKLKSPFIIEDSGLFVKALNDFPGVYSSFVYHTIGCDGILKLMKGVKEREAMFVSVIGLKFKNKEKIFKGECSGKISEEILGKGGFGYDPLFIPEGEKKTFAEMSIEEKNRYSHRGKAVEKLAAYLTSSE